MTRRLTNQDAFDGAMLTLLNQGHGCVSSSGQVRYRGPRGKSAIGALIPDEMYAASMEGKKVHHWLAARGSEYDALRERLGSVTPSLLDELQDLHDRAGSCMPSLYRQLAVDGAQRIAQSFKLSMSLVNRCATYQHLRGPKFLGMVVTPPIPVAAPVVEVAPASAVAAIPDVAAVREVAAIPAVAAIPVSAPIPDAAAVVPGLAAAAPTPAPASEPMRLAEDQQEDLDLFARGIAKAIAAATAQGIDQSRHR